MPLTDALIRQAAPRDKDWKLADSGGLFLLIRPRGSRLWQFKYRMNGREQKLSFGPYPLVSLKHARALRDEAKLEIFKGGHPARRRREAKIAASIHARDRFEDVAAEYIQKRELEGLAASTIEKATWLLDQLRPSIGRRPIREITPRDLLSALKKIEQSGRRETARRVRSLASRVFRYAVATLRADSDPAQLLRGALIAPVTRHYAAITEPEALGELLRAIDGYEGRLTTRFALRIAPHVFLRPGELRNAEWTEIDLENAVWRIPAARMKMRRPHAIPLSTQVTSLFAELGEATGRNGFVFRSVSACGRPICENTMNGALRRMGFSTDEVTTHGLRATASTLLNESGLWSSDAIERSLAHQDFNAVRGIYHRGRHWQERLAMAQWWSDYLDQLRRKSSPHGGLA
jgi:integrase